MDYHQLKRKKSCHKDIRQQNYRIFKILYLNMESLECIAHATKFKAEVKMKNTVFFSQVTQFSSVVIS